MVFGSVFSCSISDDYTDDSRAGSSSCPAQCCRCGGVFPDSAVLALVLGNSVLA